MHNVLVACVIQLPVANAASNISDDILTIPECCTDSTQCYTETNEVPAAEMIMATCQIIQCDDKKTELILEKQILLPTDSLNSELVIRHTITKYILYIAVTAGLCSYVSFMHLYSCVLL